MLSYKQFVGDSSLKDINNYKTYLKSLSHPLERKRNKSLKELSNFISSNVIKKSESNTNDKTSLNYYGLTFSKALHCNDLESAAVIYVRKKYLHYYK